jgi:hypothetical protein
MANRVMADPPNADANADATTRAICAVVDLWTSVDRLTDECSSTQYIKLCNESRGDGGEDRLPARAPADPNATSEVLQRAEQALEAIDGGQNFTSAELEQRLREIRSRLLAVLAECNTTELEMQYVRSRT